MKLSIVIVNWNTRDYVLRCLASLVAELQHFASNEVEIIVVDNASGDGSPAAIRTHYPMVQLLLNQQNGGFAAANNQAIRASQGDYVLLLNPDTEIKPGALTALVAFMDMHPEAGAAGARLVNADGTLQISCHPLPSIFREWWRLFHLDDLLPLASYPATLWQTETPVEVDVIQGACMLLRREALYQVGLLDEQYFMYSEEVDLCHRIQLAGWRLYWLPDAAVVHHGGQSTRQVAREMFLELYRSKLLYFRIHNGRLGGALYKALLLGASLARLLLSPMARLESPTRRREHENLTGHYRHLLRLLPKM